MAAIYSKYPPNASQSVPTVPTAASLPAVGAYDGQLYITLDTDSLYAWNQNSGMWVLLNSASTVTGSGATGKAAIWTSASALGVSSASGIIYFTSGAVNSIADGTANKVLGMNAAANGYEYKSILGTANQVVVTQGVGTITLSSPQDVGPGSSPTFVGLTLSGLTPAGVVHNDSGGVLSTSLIVNADVSASAAIAYSKLNLAGSIVNNDISTGAAIAYSKLNLTGSIVNADISGSAAIAYSKLNLAGSIVNADINSSAAIAVSKLAALTASRAVVTDGSGFLAAATTTATEIGYVNGVTSSIQTQLNAKSPTANPTFTGTVNITGNLIATSTLAGSNLSGTNTGDVTLANVGNSPANAGASLSGQVLTLQPADATHPGVISTTTQVIPGDKEFAGAVTLDSTLAVTGRSAFTGVVGILGGNNTSIALWINATSLVSSATDQYGVISQPISSSSATVSMTGFYSGVTTAASAFTCGVRYQFFGANPTKGAGSTITRDITYGGTVATQGGTGNAFIADNASFTGSFFIHSTNANKSVLGGVLALPDGAAAAPAHTFTNDLTVGTYLVSSGLGFATAGVQVGTVSSAGLWTFGASGGTEIHRFNVSTAATAANTGTLTNMPAGISGNPSGYMRLNINGSSRIFPFWG